EEWGIRRCFASKGRQGRQDSSGKIFVHSRWTKRRRSGARQGSAITGRPDYSQGASTLCPQAHRRVSTAFPRFSTGYPQGVWTTASTEGAWIRTVELPGADLSDPRGSVAY